MTEAMTVRPTRSGTVRFALFYASLITIPFAATWLIMDGPGSALLALAAGYLIAGLAFAALVGAGWYRLDLTPRGLQTGFRRRSILPWGEVDQIETGRFLGQEIWVRLLGRPDGPRKRSVLAVLPAFLFGMSAAELRDLLAMYLKPGTGSPT